MRERSALYRLSFILPDKLYRTVRQGVHAPCLHGCLLTVHGAGLVVVEGRPEQSVLQQALLWLRGRGELSIPAVLVDDAGARRAFLITGGSRSLTIVPREQLQLPGLERPGLGDVA